MATDGVNELCVSDVLEDMKEECQKYGSVVSLLIPKENPGKGQVSVSALKSCDSHVLSTGGRHSVARIHSFFHSFLSQLPVCVCAQVFVEFANSSESKEAQRLLTGRTFDGKFVVATFYPLSAYRRGYFYPTLQ